MQHQVAKIDGVHRHQALLVLAVEIHRPALRETAGIGGRNLLGAETAILPALNLREQQAGGPAPLVDVLRLQDLLQQPDLVIGVEDREARLEPDRLGVPAQNARGDRMKGAEPHALGGAADHRFQPLAHLARRLVGEGDGEQFGRESAAGGDRKGEPGGQHAGLAGAGAGEHQHRPVDRLDGPALRVIEAAEVEYLGVRASEDSRFGHALHDIAREARMMHPHPPRKPKPGP